MNRAPLLIAALTAALYLPRLSSAPAYLAPDEVFIALHANSIAATGRDYGGRFLPLYVEYNYFVYDRSGKQLTRSGWLPPIIFYLMALVLKILPLSEFSVRLPTVLVGIVDVVLMYFIGRRLFRNELLAILSAALLALTPAHVIHSRLGMDYLYPLPFLLAWLLALLGYFDSGRPKLLFISTLALGIGVYSYIAAALAMPLYFLLTLAALLFDRRPARAHVTAALGFLVPAALYVPWLVAHPSAFLDVLGKYGLGPAAGMTAAQSVRSFLTFHGIGDQLSHVWTFFDPRFLFFDGPMELMYSTRTVGVFLLPVAGLLAVGVLSAFRGPTTSVTVLLLVGLVIAPIPATVVNVTDAIYRALELLPFLVLLSVFGVQHLWSLQSFKPRRRVLVVAGLALLAAGAAYAVRGMVTQSRIPGTATTLLYAGAVTIVLGLSADRLRLGQMIALALLAIVPLQFAYFYVDYFTDYRHRASLVFSGNIRGAFEEAMHEDQQAGAPTIYLGKIGPYGKGELYWKFYVTKHRRQELAARTINAEVFDSDRVLKLKAGSLIVTNAGEGETDAIVDRLVAAGQLSKTVIREPDGTPSFLVLRRTDGA